LNLIIIKNFRHGIDLPITPDSSLSSHDKKIYNYNKNKKDKVEQAK